MVRQDSAQWRNIRGEGFHLTGWAGPKGARTALLIHHGLGEHIGRYDTFARRLSGRMPLWGYDIRGHGRSEGPRGDADGLSQLAEDLETVLPVLLQRSGAERIVLLGHSLGAATVGWYLATRRPHPAIRAVMLSAPPVAIPRDGVVAAKLAAARLLRRIHPSLTLPNGLPAHQISSVPSEVARYLADPWVHDQLSVRLGWSLAHQAPELPARLRTLDLPVLLWHGAEDGIALPVGSQQLASALPEVQHHEIPAARHEVHHERVDVVRDLFRRIDGFLDEVGA